MFDIHYGDVLIKYGSVLDAEKADVPKIANDAVANRQTCDCLQDGDVIIADTAEDSAVGKCTELCNSAGKKVFSGLHTMPLRPMRKYASGYLGHYLNSPAFHDQLLPLMQGIKVISVSRSAIEDMTMSVPSVAEQASIGAFFDRLDSLITLHQRKYDGCAYPLFFLRKVHAMQETITSESLFCDYYTQWVKTYKEGAIRDVTMGKYRLAQSWLGKLIPELKLADMDRTAYQRLINGYAQHHERQTTMDFHHQIKGAILDAVDEGLIPRDPTRKVIIKGKQPRIKKMKYLNQFELHAMLADLDLGAEASWDWLILLIAKTGLRFSEALGLTPETCMKAYHGHHHLPSRYAKGY